MSIHTALVAALASVAGGRVYPQIAPSEATYPLVNYRILNKEKIVDTFGTVLAINYQIVFDCWGKTYASALSTAAAVRAAIIASSLDYTPIDEPGEEFDASADMYYEQVHFSFLDQ